MMMLALLFSESFVYNVRYNKPVIIRYSNSVISGIIEDQEFPFEKKTDTNLRQIRLNKYPVILKLS